MMDQQPFALFIRGPKNRIFELSDQLGFDTDMQALAVSVFEDGPDSMHVQALYEKESEADAAQSSLNLEGLENFITQLPEENWTAKSQAGLPPVHAGPFFIHGAHDSDKIPEDTPYPIQIDAGIAFGTGHHGTTKGCLLAFEEYARTHKPEKILDLGCGAGVLAIAATKTYEINVMATDIDPDSIDVTNANAKLNSVASLIDAVVADGFDAAAIKARSPFDLIFANILAGPLLILAPDIASALAPNGHVILSGLLVEQAETIIAAYRSEGLILVSHSQLAGWSTLTMQKA